MIEQARKMKEPDRLELVYDGQCPICKAYCHGLLKESPGASLTLVDARHPGPLMDDITAAGLNIDEGMVLKTGDKLFYGADAIYELSQRHKTHGLWGRINRIFFSSKFLAKLFYPLGKTLRNIILRILGIQKIRNLQSQK